jgi:hypothetical protein
MLEESAGQSIGQAGCCTNRSAGYCHRAATRQPPWQQQPYRKKSQDKDEEEDKEEKKEEEEERSRVATYRVRSSGGDAFNVPRSSSPMVILVNKTHLHTLCITSTRHPGTGTRSVTASGTAPTLR